MPENRNDKEAELNNLARLFALNYVSLVTSMEAELPAVLIPADGYTKEYCKELLNNNDLYLEKLKGLCEELGYAPYPRNPSRAELTVMLEKGEIG